MTLYLVNVTVAGELDVGELLPASHVRKMLRTLAPDTYILPTIDHASHVHLPDRRTVVAVRRVEAH